MPDTIFRHGNPTMMDYTPGADLAGGTVVVTAAAGGLTCAIAHGPIPANQLGALALGGGVYDVVNLNNAANYVKVYWDNVAKKVTTTATSNALFGYIVSGGAGGANSICRAYHWPFV